MELIVIPKEDLQNIIARIVEREVNRAFREHKSLFHEEVFMTIGETAEYHGVVKSTLYQLTSKRKIPHYKPTGNRLYFKRSNLEQWVLDHRVKTDEEIEAEAMDYVIKKRRH